MLQGGPRRPPEVAAPASSDRFGIEPEITAKLFKRGARVYEVPITYEGRDYSEGKKITWRDGFPALWTLVKYRFVGLSAADRASARPVRPVRLPSAPVLPVYCLAVRRLPLT